VKYICSKNHHVHVQRLSAANCRVTLNYSKSHRKIFVYSSDVVMLASLNSLTTDIHSGHIKNCTTDCATAATKKKHHGKMPHMISDRLVAHGVSQSVSESKLLCGSLIFVDTEVKNDLPSNITREKQCLPITGKLSGQLFIFKHEQGT